MYATDALASSYGCPKTKLWCKNEKWDIPRVEYYCQVSDEILRTPSREFRRTGRFWVVLVSVPEHSAERLPEISPTTFRRVSSSFGGSHSQAFPRRNPGGSSLRSDTNLLALQRSWFELGRGALAQIDILQWYEALNEDYGELYESHRSCQGVSDRLTETHNHLLDDVRSRNQLFEDHQALQQVHLGCVGNEADLTEKLAAVEKESGASLGHWLLDSSGTSCASGKMRHLAIGSLTHLERLAFWVRCATWPLALGLIRSVKHMPG
nr:hypothetical protein [Tanacetum cinerariifolium]